VIEHRTLDRPRGGIGTTRGTSGQPDSRQSAGGEGRTLMDMVRRLLRPVRLPIPPRPQKAARRREAAVPLRRFRQPSGPRRARTVTCLLAGEVHCYMCFGPRVRGAGVEPAVPNGAWVTTRCRPTTASRGWDRFMGATCTRTVH
jgi:hypothetical protein